MEISSGKKHVRFGIIDLFPVRVPYQATDLPVLSVAKCQLLTSAS